jgi:outer membrane protein assembly factor BamB
LPAAISSAVATGDIVFAIDRSLERAFVINARAAKLVSDVRLSGRVVGSPVITNLNGPSVAIAFEDGRLQILDATGKFIRSGDAGGAVTTAPLFVTTPRGEFVLVGTRNALTALNAEDLRPLGRATLKDSPRGSLYARDLDNDGAPEVVLFTDSGRVVVVKSDEGKVVWEADAQRAEAASFADVNNDHVLDLLMIGREGSAFALSGRDGAMIWKDESSVQIVTNHAPAATRRSSLVVSTPAGVLFIATDAGNGGLRALELSKAVAPRN